MGVSCIVAKMLLSAFLSGIGFACVGYATSTGFSASVLVTHNGLLGDLGFWSFIVVRFNSVVMTNNVILYMQPGSAPRTCCYL
jgi:hypothetical protein